MIEFIALEVPDGFLNQEINITRLAESLLFILNRTTIGADATQFDSLLSQYGKSGKLYCNISPYLLVFLCY
jgi:hypothetical protein